MDPKEIMNNAALTLDEKLAKIDELIQQKTAKLQEEHVASGVEAPFDPALATICDGCE